MESFKKTDMKNVDMSAVQEVMDIKNKQLAGIRKSNPDDILKMDTRIREGLNSVEDPIEIEGRVFAIPQLTVVDVRRASIIAFRSIQDTTLAKKLVSSMRTKAAKSEMTKELTPQEVLMWAEVTIEEDVILVWMSLKKGKHPKITGDIEKDREFVENLRNFDKVAKLVRKINAVGPEGAEEVKSFPVDDIRGDNKK